MRATDFPDLLVIVQVLIEITQPSFNICFGMHNPVSDVYISNIFEVDSHVTHLLMCLLQGHIPQCVLTHIK